MIQRLVIEKLQNNFIFSFNNENRLNKLAKKSKKIIAASCTSPSNILRLKDKGEKLKKFTNKQKDSDKTKNTKLQNGLIEGNLRCFLSKIFIDRKLI